ncbi:hypothetical protein ABB07_37150 [Streptomyces incarnatus]|uniref:Uncharacterized protein n=1 Tax=Streptomyces incarnatus TaxID=665007 RepID=A0ABM5TWP7_9ACTN|nr:hypothetical protein ABB07_37150 [Streptomyces incarnatus]
MRQQRGAGRGEGDRAAVPVEQPHTQVLLEHLDLLGQRGARDEQTLGGPPEVQLLGDGDELPQLTQLHTRHATRRETPPVSDQEGGLSGALSPPHGTCLRRRVTYRWEREEPTIE